MKAHLLLLLLPAVQRLQLGAAAEAAGLQGLLPQGGGGGAHRGRLEEEAGAAQGGRGRGRPRLRHAGDERCIPPPPFYLIFPSFSSFSLQILPHFPCPFSSAFPAFHLISLFFFFSHFLTMFSLHFLHHFSFVSLPLPPQFPFCFSTSFPLLFSSLPVFFLTSPCLFFPHYPRVFPSIPPHVVTSWKI